MSDFDGIARCVLVVPYGVQRPTTGSGQRTRLFLDAARAEAPTDVVVLGAQDGHRAWLEPFFPGARRVHCLPAAGFGPSQGGPGAWLGKNVARFALQGREYGPDADLEARVGAIAAEGPGPCVVLFRYARTFCVAGGAVAADPGIVACVDVDDRDDQRFETEFARVIGPRLTAGLVRPAVLAPMARRIDGALEAASHVWVAAPQDAAPARCSVVPNVPAPAPERETAPPPSAGRDVLFVGISRHPPNVAGVAWFLRRCWPGIRRRAPGARLRIVGRGDWAAALPEAARAEGVDIVGEVDDLAAEYARARVAICPVQQGGGSKIKLVEACAWGRPVVAARHALRGFEALAEGPAVVTDDPERTADACLCYLHDGAQADADGAALRRLQGQRYGRAAALAAIRSDLLAQVRGPSAVIPA